MDDRAKAMLRRGAEAGIPLGLIMIGVMATLVASTTSTSIVWPALTLFLAISVPATSYRLLERSFVASKFKLRFSEVWFEGILMFVCGAMLLTAMVLVYLRWIAPEYMPGLLHYVAETGAGNADPTIAQGAEVAQRMIEFNMVPRPMEIALSLGWSAAFSGSLLSLLLAVFITRRPRKTPFA